MGRRKAEGGRVTAEGGRRKEEGGRGLRRKADGGVSELRTCSYLAGLHSWTTEEFVRREEVVGVRFSEVAFCVVAVFWVVRVGVEHSIARC